MCELAARKEAARSREGYNPAIVLMSPFEDERLVLAQYRREHPDAGDVELICYAMQPMRLELTTPASRAAGAAWQAQTAQAVAKYAATVSHDPLPHLPPAAPVDKVGAPPRPAPPYTAPPPAADAPALQPRNNDSPRLPYRFG
jgi:hypothetical protein